MSEPLNVTVFSDVICPWCYIGKRRFEAGLAATGLPGGVALSWKPFELNPDMPAEGMERAAYRAMKFGAEKSAELDRHLAEMGRGSGVHFAFDKMKRTPNTRLAHRLIWEAERQGDQNPVVNRLFSAYFEEGADIGNADVLTDIAREAGLEAGGVKSAFEQPESLSAVVALEGQAQRMGIQGVPFFILIGKYGVSGAQPPEVWQQVLPQVATEAAGGEPAA